MHAQLQLRPRVREWGGGGGGCTSSMCELPLPSCSAVAAPLPGNPSTLAGSSPASVGQGLGASIMCHRSDCEQINTPLDAAFSIAVCSVTFTHGGNARVRLFMQPTVKSSLENAGKHHLC